MGAGFGFGLGFATALTPATPTCVGGDGCGVGGGGHGGSGDGCGALRGAGRRLRLDPVAHRGGGGDGEAQGCWAGVDGQGERDGGSADDAQGGDGLDGPRRADAREAVRETTYGTWSATSTG